MKKLSFILFLVFLTTFCFADELPVFMVEINSGYATGINLNNAALCEIRLLYPYKRFGFAIGAGGIFAHKYKAFQGVLGPMFLFINNDKWRLPLIIGGSILSTTTDYFGISGILAVHYRLQKNIYIGTSIDVSYYFNNMYKEYVGDQKTITRFDDGTTKTQTVPIMQNTNHYGNSFYIKPSMVLGLQY
jgi:hypothetical protein